ncbi:hypothetical protein RchiOBHm_Chr1g0329471 [Rosa chinensis]|uniref:Uncharacterized protein n=1 Tax=Rosa chinensis TaxID=74649 RepID=A0A2P6SB13_ROSCH|nr:hypothetical protein RchiOBHm_Chr1g0329471 [Rosa chinensis]
MSVVKNLANFTIFSNPIGLVNRSHLYVLLVDRWCGNRETCLFFHITFVYIPSMDVRGHKIKKINFNYKHIGVYQFYSFSCMTYTLHLNCLGSF